MVPDATSVPVSTGWLTPPNMTIKDCGDNNRIVRGTLIDTTADPCF